MTTVRQSELKVSITLQQNATRHPSPRSWEAEFSECCSPHTRHQAAPARRTALALRHATRHPGMSASRLERPDLSRDPRAVVRSPQRSTAAVCAGGHVPPAAHRARPGPARTRCAPIGLPRVLDAVPGALCRRAVPAERLAPQHPCPVGPGENLTSQGSESPGRNRGQPPDPAHPDGAA